MKKLTTILLVVALSLTCSVAALANSFLSSPSTSPVPTVEDVTDGVTVTVTGYADRDNLPEDVRKALEDAYAEIAACTDLTKLCPDLAKLNIPAARLAVSNLFDISASDAINGTVTIKLGVDVDNFVGLIHRENGAWTLADATLEGDTLTVKVDSLSPFAIVVDTNPSGPVMGDSGIWLWAMVAVASGAAIVFCVFGYKKQLNAAK